MANPRVYDVNTAVDAVVSTNKVLRNTYMLLGMTLLFSAMTAGISMAVGLPQGAALILTLVGFGLLFVVNRMADSSKGLIAIFAFTGVMGAALGPMLNYYLAMPGGPALVLQALAGTAVVFFGLSAYALTTRKDFSFMGGFLMGRIDRRGRRDDRQHLPGHPGAVADDLGGRGNDHVRPDPFRHQPHHQRRRNNYIRATVGLYLNIYNLFVHILHLLTALSGDD